MADAIALPQAPPISIRSQFFRLIPGVLLLAAIGYAGKFLEQNLGAYAKSHHWIFPNIEYVLWAILLGLFISNTIGVAKIFQPGVATYEFWLKAGIVLLGSRFLLGDVLKLGGVSLILVGHRDPRRPRFHDPSRPPLQSPPQAHHAPRRRLRRLRCQRHHRHQRRH